MTATIDGRIYPHEQEKYATPFDLRRHLVNHINADTAYIAAWIGRSWIYLDYYATSSDLRRHLMNHTNALYAYAWIGRRQILQATSFDLRRQRVTLIYHFVTST